MKLLIDMNLSPAWVSVLEEAGHEAIHWSTVGSPSAPDHEILSRARREGYVLFTHDLDFSAILAATDADAPSVIQVRAQDVTPESAKDAVLDVIKGFREDLLRAGNVARQHDKLQPSLLRAKLG